MNTVEKTAKEARKRGKAAKEPRKQKRQRRPRRWNLRRVLVRTLQMDGVNLLGKWMRALYQCHHRKNRRAEATGQELELAVVVALSPVHANRSQSS